MPLRVGVGEDSMREGAARLEFSCLVLSFAPVVLFDDDDWVSMESYSTIMEIKSLSRLKDIPAISIPNI